MPSLFKTVLFLRLGKAIECALYIALQDETITIETVFPFDVAVKFVSTKVCSVKLIGSHLGYRK